jgi:hypothetical protein
MLLLMLLHYMGLLLLLLSLGVRLLLLFSSCCCSCSFSPAADTFLLCFPRCRRCWCRCCCSSCSDNITPAALLLWVGLPHSHQQRTAHPMLMQIEPRPLHVYQNPGVPVHHAPSLNPTQKGK